MGGGHREDTGIASARPVSSEERDERDVDVRVSDRTRPVPRRHLEPGAPVPEGLELAFPSGILIQPYRTADARQSAATERIGGIRVDRTRGTELAIVASLDVSATREGLLSRLG